MRSLLLPLLPALMRHLSAYAEVASADARDAGVLLARRIMALVLAAVAAVIALVMLCVWILALTWDGPWRAWTAAGLAIVFASAAAGVAIPLLRRGSTPAPDFFHRVRGEWQRDRELIERALKANSRDGTGGDGIGANGESVNGSPDEDARVAG
ncbi:MAG: hypothetical protein ACREVI_09225 [Steroidobacteraceae bacterium]